MHIPLWGYEISTFHSASLVVLKLTHSTRIQLVNGNNVVPNSSKHLLQNLDKAGSLDNAAER